MSSSAPRVCIVGNGPSLLSTKKGTHIDACDFVIRTKLAQFGLDHPELYGTRTDAICGSWTIRESLKAHKAEEKWVFIDSRHRADAERPQYRCRAGDIKKVRGWAYINPSLCDKWNADFRKRRGPFERAPGMMAGPHSDARLGHNHLSAGFHAILYACEKLELDELYLAGYDNVMSGGFTWSISRGPRWDKYPDHRWDIEHAMLGDVAEEFSCKILPL